MAKLIDWIVEHININLKVHGVMIKPYAFEYDHLKVKATRIIQIGDEKCNIPCIALEVPSEGRYLVEIRLTWKEVEKLIEDLTRLLKEREPKITIELDENLKVK